MAGDAQLLVSCGDGRFLVAVVHGQRLAIALEVTVLDPCGA